MKISPHFSDHEFACRHCGRMVHVDHRLLDVLETIRAITGTPLRVVSGYRCPVHNRAVGGAPRSRHLFGDAADIPAGRATIAQAAAAGAVGIGSRGSWAVHVDTRPGGRARWRY